MSEPPLTYNEWLRDVDERVDERKRARMSFDKYREKQAKRQSASICPRCRQNEKKGSVHLQLREKTEGRAADKGLASESVSLCEPCSVVLYDELDKTFERVLRAPDL